MCMACEIELKAHVEDSVGVKKTLDKIAFFRYEFIKEDVYWMPGPEANGARLPKSGIRIRKEKTANNYGENNFFLVTYKTKERRSNIEVNKENEFIIKSANPDSGEDEEEAIGAFEYLLSSIGMVKSISKKKQGFYYNYEEISAELTFVEKLGWFLELEVISKASDDETVSKIKDTLLALLKKTGISEDKIEPRYYNEMLQEAAVGVSVRRGIPRYGGASCPSTASARTGKLPVSTAPPSPPPD